MEFIFNNSGVCVNPEQVYYFILPNDLAWRYLELTVCENQEGKWDFGVNSLNVSFSPSIRGEFASKDQAISAGIDYLIRAFQTNSNFWGNSEKHKSHFFNWMRSKKQLTLF